MPLRIDLRLTDVEQMAIDRWALPGEITVTRRIVELPGGAFYPAETTWEKWNLDVEHSFPRPSGTK